ncbi:hypothetical protein CEUSTIGMA_g4914.t1 [Chlamydomonas eustigma]|uniref:Magnesium transporter n=1 Tax=Chlamydomonas eustigma TaxID=1157962 RepID=A0A250X3X7_9CHLO|nr:hypothetical protein CEUSTIGMA_g4914.t1 [Chlamydomonas eustigma]|eukprot:GAX77470.1 hypothetical protein CEUSTIGMA_g4914.t1 [Chlamydomonas eustigma]
MIIGVVASPMSISDTEVDSSSASFINRDRAFEPSFHTSKRVRFDTDVEFKLAAGSSTRVVASVYDYSTIADDTQSDEREISVSDKRCNSEGQLIAALTNVKSKDQNGGKCWVNISQPEAGSVHRPSLTLEKALRLLQHYYGLQAFSVLDAMTPTHRCRLDNYPGGLYCSMLAFSNGSSASSYEKRTGRSSVDMSLQKKGVRRLKGVDYSSSRDIEQPLITPDEKHLPVTDSKKGRSVGTLHDLLHTGLQLHESDNWKHAARPQSMSMVHWQRVSFFLSSSCVISIFNDPHVALSITKEVRSYFSMPEVHIMELSQKPGFLFYKLIEALVEQLTDVLVPYRWELLTAEERTFKQDRPNQEDDVRQTRQLHLMQQELAMLRQHLLPAERIIGTLMNVAASAASAAAAAAAQHNFDGMSVSQHSAEDQGSFGSLHKIARDMTRHDPEEGHSPPLCSPLLTEQTLDFLEEVQDDVKARLVEIEQLVESCKQLSDLMFALASYRSSVSAQTLAGVTVVFLPLTFLAGIYGMNFEILPELTWGVEADHIGQPPGYPAGYVFFCDVCRSDGTGS